MVTNNGPFPLVGLTLIPAVGFPSVTLTLWLVELTPKDVDTISQAVYVVGALTALY
jgi:hypothetical protein